jgi:hypothetical protein
MPYFHGSYRGRNLKTKVRISQVGLLFQTLTLILMTLKAMKENLINIHHLGLSALLMEQAMDL